MEVTLQTIRQVFEAVLSGRMSREQADRWAYSVVEEQNSGNLILASSDEDRIWAGVMYLYGVDIMTAPGMYLHTDEDIKTAMAETLGQV